MFHMLAETLPLVPAAARVRRVAVIFNPTAGKQRRRRLDETLSALTTAGLTITLRETAAAGDAWKLAAAVTVPEADALLVAGGDGTINEAVNGLLQSKRGLPLGIVPLGTANVLAGELNLPRTPEALAQVIPLGRRRWIALGRANGRYFVQMAGVGFDAQVVEHLNLALKRRLRQGAYVIESLRQMRRFDFPKYRILLGSEVIETRSAIITLGRSYGGPFLLAPQAGHETAAFQLCLFDRGGPWSVLRYGQALLRGKLPQAAGFHCQAAQRLSIEGPAGDPVQGDGDIIARLPVSLEHLPMALQVLVP